jgi:hypothetical protein
MARTKGSKDKKQRKPMTEEQKKKRKPMTDDQKSKARESMANARAARKGTPAEIMANARAARKGTPAEIIANARSAIADTATNAANARAAIDNPTENMQYAQSFRHLDKETRTEYKNLNKHFKETHKVFQTTTNPTKENKREDIEGLSDLNKAINSYINYTSTEEQEK